MTRRPPSFRGIFRDDPDARGVYAEAAGIGRIVPRAVAVPADADDVAALVRWAAEERVPLVPRGSGSSVVGAAIVEGVVVDLGALAVLGPIDAAARRVRCGPGVVQRTVDQAARRVGLRFPVDPSSAAYCTVGGMAATNAAGAHSLRFGAMRSWVTALDCVFADGSRATVRRGAPPPAGVPAVERFLRDVAPEIARAGAAAALPVRKNSSGYAIADHARSGELVDLLVGSEGTLALFVGIELALVEAPGATASLLALFPRLAEARVGAAASRETGAGACELLDRTFLDVAAQGGTAAVDAAIEAALLI